VTDLRCMSKVIHTHFRENSRTAGTFLTNRESALPRIEDHYLTANIVCQFPPIFQRACGRAAEWAAFYIENGLTAGRPRLKCDGTRAETILRLFAKRTSPFKSAGASVQSSTGSRGVRISGSNAGYTMFRGSVRSTGYPLHSPICPPLPLPCVTVCHHISTGLYYSIT
jgi:hypothetical protein